MFERSFLFSVFKYPFNTEKRLSIVTSYYNIINLSSCWRVKEARSNKNTCCVRQIAELIRFYRPNVIVIENYTVKGCRRCLRVRKLLHDIRKFAEVVNELLSSVYQKLN